MAFYLAAEGIVQGIRFLGILGLLGSEARAAETITYTYDAQGRLIQAVHSGTVNSGVQSLYTFDAADNRTNVTVIGGTSRVIVVPLNGLTVIPIPTDF